VQHACPLRRSGTAPGFFVRLTRGLDRLIYFVLSTPSDRGKSLPCKGIYIFEDSAAIHPLPADDGRVALHLYRPRLAHPSLPLARLLCRYTVGDGTFLRVMRPSVRGFSCFSGRSCSPSPPYVKPRKLQLGGERV
jgi:hypothetical protein